MIDGIEVSTLSHQVENQLKPREISSLGGTKRVVGKERNYHSNQVTPALHGETQHEVVVIVPPPIGNNGSATEELPDQLKCFKRTC